MFQLLTTSDFRKDLEKLEQLIQQRIKDKIKFLNTVENPLTFSTKLKGKNNFFRFRVGSYRMIFRLEKNRIILLAVDHRKDIYEE